MSGKLSLKTPSGGSVILEAVDTATDKVLTLPAVDSDVVTSAGAQTITGAKTFTVDTLIHGVRVGRGVGDISSNTVVGASALAANTTGIANTANGTEALESNTTGDFNTAIGRRALQSNTTGNHNTASGGSALRDNTTGINNTANGENTLRFNTTGFENTAVGRDALRNNTTGNNNAAVGHNALISNTTGFQNTANGASALAANTTGALNTANGWNALSLNTTGDENTAIGRIALNNITTGNNNTGLGNGAAASSATVSNTITLGNSSITTLRCQVTTITALSDARDKTNVTEIPAGLSFVEALRPVAFDWNMRDGGKVGIHEFGFIAQELQAAQVETGVTVPNLVYDDNPEKLEAGYGALIPVLVKAIQEQQVMISELKARLDAANL